MSSYKKISLPKDLAGIILIFVVVGVAKACIVDVNYVISGSMKPTLQVNDNIVSYKFQYGIRVPQTNYYLYRSERPSAGDVVLFEGDTPSLLTTWAKRVIAVGGDKISIENKILYINDNKISCTPKMHDDHYLCDEKIGVATAYQVKWRNESNFIQDNLSSFTIPTDYVFLMGDNRNNSLDSRYFGVVHIDKIYGKQVYRFSGTTHLYLYVLLGILVLWGLNLTICHVKSRFKG